MLIGQRMCHLVGQRDLLLLAVELLFAAEQSVEKARLLSGVLGDQEHLLRFRVIKACHLFGEQPDHHFGHIQLRRRQAEQFHRAVEEEQLLRRHLRREFFRHILLQRRPLHDSRRHLPAERSFANLGQNQLVGAFVSDQRLRVFLGIRQLVAFGQQGLRASQRRLFAADGGLKEGQQRQGKDQPRRHSKSRRECHRSIRVGSRPKRNCRA